MSEKVPPHCSVYDCIVNILRYIGEDPEREGLKETPARVIQSWGEIFKGYIQDPEKILKTFEDGSESYDEIIVLKDISFHSTCEHHMLPFSGVGHIAYLPKDRIVGISKLVRLLEVFSRRLQVQERITVQVTQALDKYLMPSGSACVLEATHGCMQCRGVKTNATMVTSSLSGEFRIDPAVRSEFFRLIGK